MFDLRGGVTNQRDLLDQAFNLEDQDLLDWEG